MKKNPILIICSICCFGLGIICFLAGAIALLAVPNPNVNTIFFVIGSILSTLGLILLILQVIIHGFNPVNEDPIVIVKEVKTVDVKEVKETQEDRLYKEYEKLFKEGLITQEELAQKKKDLLQK